MDGYTNLITKFIEMKELVDNQVQINNEIKEISDEIITLPQIPDDLERWTESLSDIDSKNFKLSDFKKMFKFNKRYTELMERKENNTLKIRVLAIDNLLNKIKNILDK